MVFTNNRTLEKYKITITYVFSLNFFKPGIKYALKAENSGDFHESD